MNVVSVSVSPGVRARVCPYNMVFLNITELRDKRDISVHGS